MKHNYLYNAWWLADNETGEEMGIFVILRDCNTRTYWSAAAWNIPCMFYVDTAKFLSDGCPPIAVSAVNIRLNCVNRGIVLFQEQSTYNDPPDSAVTTQKPPEQIQNIWSSSSSKLNGYCLFAYTSAICSLDIIQFLKTHFITLAPNIYGVL